MNILNKDYEDANLYLSEGEKFMCLQVGKLACKNGLATAQIASQAYCEKWNLEQPTYKSQTEIAFKFQINKPK